jgi:hypothetical protein
VYVFSTRLAPRQAASFSAVLNSKWQLQFEYLSLQFRVFRDGCYIRWANWRITVQQHDFQRRVSAGLGVESHRWYNLYSTSSGSVRNNGGCADWVWLTLAGILRWRLKQDSETSSYFLDRLSDCERLKKGRTLRSTWRSLTSFGIFRRVVTELRYATVSFVVAFCLSVRMEHLGSHWTGFHEIWYEYFSNICR